MRKIVFGSLSIVLVTLMVLGFSACDENNNLVLFSIEDDKSLGLQVSNEIAGDPSTYPVMDETTNAQAYAYLNAIKDAILNSGAVAYKDEFVWKLHIINDDATLNAFATPGGYIYVYTGLIKYLERVDDLAGVMGHEIAHADLRHTSRNIQKEYGVSVLLSILLGDNAGEIVNIAAELASGAAYLQFSRDFEQEADAKSVEYLAKTQYACNGAAHFFELLEASGQTSGTPTFLSTHPSPVSRIEDINAKAEEENCDITPTSSNTSGMTYEEFQALFN